MKKAIAMLLLGLSVLFGCQKNNSSSGAGSGVAYAQITLKSTALNLSSEARTNSWASSTCSVQPNGASGPVSGKCVTPTAMKATATTILLSSQYGGKPYRLQGGGFTGLQGLFGYSAFDFHTATPLGGTNNFTDESSTVYFDRLQVNVSALEVQFPAGSSTQYYNVRYVFFTQPPSSDTTIAGCVTGGDKGAFDAAGSLYFSDTAKTTPMAITKGDILVCVKSTKTATCNDTDYQWVDSSGNLSSTRPANPLQLAGTYLSSAPKCTAGSYDNFSIPGAIFYASITSPFTLTAAQIPSLTPPTIDPKTKAYVGGQTALPIQYTFTSGCTVASGGQSGTCTGTPTSGANLTATMDFDLTNAIFFPTAAADPDNGTQTQILSNLNQILPKPIYMENNKTLAGTGYTPGVNVAVTATVQ